MFFFLIKCNKKLSTECSFGDPPYFKIGNKTKFSSLVKSYSFCYRAERGYPNTKNWWTFHGRYIHCVAAT